MTRVTTWAKQVSAEVVHEPVVRGSQVRGAVLAGDELDFVRGMPSPIYPKMSYIDGVMRRLAAMDRYVLEDNLARRQGRGQGWTAQGPTTRVK